MFPQKKRSPSRAFSLIESAIVLGIVGLVVGGIWAAAARINSVIKINQTANGLALLADGYIKLHEGLKMDSFPSGSNGVNGKIFPVIPDGFILKSNGYITDPFGHDMYIDTYKMGNNVALQFYVGGQSVESCINLMVKLSSVPHIWRFSYDPANNVYTNPPVKLNNAVTYCTTRTQTTTAYSFTIF